MTIPIQEMMANLPAIFHYLQVFSYVVLVLFFGATAMKGWKGYLPFYFKWAGRLGTGFVCLIFGLSMGEYIPTLNTGIFRILQSHIIAGGLIGAIIFSVGLYLISFRSPRVLEGYRRHIEKLHKKINAMRNVKPNKFLTIAGIAVIAVMLILSVINFRGFPSNMAEDMFSSIIPEGELPGGITLGPGMTKMTPGCLSAMAAMTELQQQPELLQGLSVYENPGLQRTIEDSASAGVVEMSSLEYQGNTLVLVLLDDSRSCIATETDFCACAQI